jgi:hypothetical protein
VLELVEELRAEGLVTVSAAEMTALAGCWNYGGRPHPTSPANGCWRRRHSTDRTASDNGRMGRWRWGGRLFRTLPEDVHDHQPLHGADGRLTLVRTSGSTIARNLRPRWVCRRSAREASATRRCCLPA